MPYQRFPKIEILSLAQHEIKFVLSDTDTSVANALRRILIAEVPTLAIDLVEFAENATVLNDEYIAHRLGMIPLRFTLPPNGTESDPAAEKGYDLRDQFLSNRECICYEHCARCSVEFELNVSYNNVADDSDEGAAPITVTSRDLHSNNPHVEPAHFLHRDEQDASQDAGISIVKLGQSGQKLKLKAVARKGIAKEHAKWSPVAVATYRFWPNIVINQERIMANLTMEQRQSLVDACSDRILELDENTGKIKEAEDAWDRATYTEDLYYAQTALKQNPADDDFVKVTPSQDRFIFNVETTGCMDADQVIMAAMRVLKDRLNYLAQELETIKEST